MKKATVKKSPAKASTKKATTKRTPKRKNEVVSVSDRDWRAQNDAQTLKSATEISSDSSRLKAAQAILKKDIAAAQKILNGKGVK